MLPLTEPTVSDWSATVVSFGKLYRLYLTEQHFLQVVDIKNFSKLQEICQKINFSAAASLKSECLWPSGHWVVWPRFWGGSFPKNHNLLSCPIIWVHFWNANQQQLWNTSSVFMGSQGGRTQGDREVETSQNKGEISKAMGNTWGLIFQQCIRTKNLHM